ncbi:immunoglobulin domain-containing protein [Salinibacter ruber]|uniref:immunoglobulin domain-containing protein n=1 Tax=Salinibacter ruber TaxID=146919 RepID=UPI0021692B9E|nr:hypothetical protein [Salinibacter ruber]MCS3695589.1 hypothetical protein [Salinibacter ruber]
MKRLDISVFIPPLLATGLVVALLFSGCDSFGGDEYRPKVTEILEVRAEPNPVAVGDTTVFTCVVEDSADTTLSFVWFLGGKLDTTRTNQIKWIAPSDTGTYNYKVQVNRPGDASVQSTQERFTVTVTDNN